jgi:serine/threonine-protein kinase
MWAVLNDQINTPPVPPSKYRPGVPPALEALVLQLLEKDLAQRPENAETVRAEVRKLRRALRVERTGVDLPALMSAAAEGGVVPAYVPAAEAPTAPEHLSGPQPQPSGGPVPAPVAAADPTTQQHAPARQPPALLVVVAVVLLAGAGLLGAMIARRGTAPPAPRPPGAPEVSAAPPPVTADAPPVAADAPPVAAETPPVAVGTPPDDEAQAEARAPKTARPGRTANTVLARLDRAARAWKVARKGRPDEDVKLFDAMLQAMQQDAAAPRADRAALKRSLDEFIRSALGGREP